ncbi:MAG TPA: hypothetical protein VH475_17445 [Tepidisphaeraceae bacterium]|jgi:hypothetical protein
MPRLLLLLVLALLAPLALAEPATVTLAPHGALLVNGRPVFPIGFTMPPPPDGKTPDGKDAIAELADAGATFLRTGPMGAPWDEQTIAREVQYLDAAARNGMYCLPYLRELATLPPGNAQREARLRDLLAKLKDHPGLGAWKGADEPDWGHQPVEPLQRAYDLIHQLDGRHPVLIIQAPRGTVDSMRAYDATYDITGADVYPISYPPGTHSAEPNKNISMVGDFTKRMVEVGGGGRKPVWMVLQIAFSGTVKPGKTLRFPTFPETRYMTYQAIATGARGLLYFGGQLPKSLSPQDARLGWNWTHWRRVLRPVIEEIGTKSPLYPALVVPDSKLPIQCPTPGVEWVAREAGNDLFLIATKREGPTGQAKFTGLPDWATNADVLFESPRTVEAQNGQFSDWFAPFDAHVYRFKHP